MTDESNLPEVRAAIDSVLAHSALPVDQADYERLLRTYPIFRDSAAALRLPEARYTEPAIIYPALRERPAPSPRAGGPTQARRPGPS
jgi:hypothetical protein